LRLMGFTAFFDCAEAFSAYERKGRRPSCNAPHNLILFIVAIFTQ
jgi:hypothetical protein